MKLWTSFLIVFMMVQLITADNCQAQHVNNVQGVVFESGTNTGIRHVAVYNKATKATTFTDSLGRFIVAASAKDTILLSKVNYHEKVLISDLTTENHVFLSRINELAEVIIKGQSVKSTLKDMEDAYKDKGIFFKGKPPIYLLSPFGGSPVTFFYELFSKDAKRARSLQKFAKREIEYTEVARRFNDNIIKSVLPDMSDIELEQFKIIFRPKAEQLAAWSDYDLLAYIKPSFEQFKKDQALQE